MLDRILLWLWAVRAWWSQAPPLRRNRIQPERFYLYAVVALGIEFALALRIVGFMAPLPVQWQWP